MRYLLDTNILSDLVRHPQGRVVARIVRLRARLQGAGTPIGSNDLLIAAQTLALGHTLVTANEAALGRIAELSLQNRLEAG